ncbi:hypothetical protein HDU85_004985 [Gaertneriomyces sp. JEL0708]|nr:hypothetical protein HDU85_004985 [Gaertneriomyces sp. JEL0708]
MPNGSSIYGPASTYSQMGPPASAPSQVMSPGTVSLAPIPGQNAAVAGNMPLYARNASMNSYGSATGPSLNQAALLQQQKFHTAQMSNPQFRQQLHQLHFMHQHQRQARAGNQTQQRPQHAQPPLPSSPSGHQQMVPLAHSPTVTAPGTPQSNSAATPSPVIPANNVRIPSTRPNDGFRWPGIPSSQLAQGNVPPLNGGLPGNLGTSPVNGAQTIFPSTLSSPAMPRSRTPSDAESVMVGGKRSSPPPPSPTMWQHQQQAQQRLQSMVTQIPANSQPAPSPVRPLPAQRIRHEGGASPASPSVNTSIETTEPVEASSVSAPTVPSSISPQEFRSQQPLIPPGYVGATSNALRFQQNYGLSHMQAPQQHHGQYQALMDLSPKQSQISEAQRTQLRQLQPPQMTAKSAMLSPQSVSGKSIPTGNDGVSKQQQSNVWSTHQGAGLHKDAAEAASFSQAASPHMKHAVGRVTRAPLADDVASARLTHNANPSIAFQPESPSKRSHQTVENDDANRSTSSAPNLRATQDSANKRYPVDRPTWARQLQAFLSTLKIPAIPNPAVSGKPLDLYAFFWNMVGMGGFQAVCNEKRWRAVAEELGLAPTGAAINSLKKIYQASLLPFERHVFSNSAERMSTTGAMAMEGQHTATMPASGVNAAPNTAAMAGRYTVYPPTNAQMRRSSLQPQHIQDGLVPTVIGSQAPLSDLPPQASSGVMLHQRLTSADLPSKPEYQPIVRDVETYGGLDFRILMIPEPPHAVPQYYGSKIDLLALAMSIKSRLVAEVGYALDVLTLVSSTDRSPVVVVECIELFDALIALLREGFERTGLFSSRKVKSYAELFEQEIEHLRSLGEYQPTLDEDDIWIEWCETVGLILRNLSFLPPNQKFMAEHVGFANLLVEMLALQADGEPSNTLRKRKRRTNGTLQQRKNAVTILSHIAPNFYIHSQHAADIILSVLSDFLEDRVMYYAYPALEAVAKLTLVHSHGHRLAAWDGLETLVERIMDMLPFQLTPECTPDDIATWEMASIALYNLAGVDDNIKQLLVAMPGLVSRLIGLTICRGIDLTNSAGVAAIMEATRSISERSIRTLVECTKDNRCKSVIALYETQLLGLASLKRGIDSEVARLVAECLWALQEYQ